MCRKFVISFEIQTVQNVNLQELEEVFFRLNWKYICSEYFYRGGKKKVLFNLEAGYLADSDVRKQYCDNILDWFNQNHIIPALEFIESEGRNLS